MLRRLTILDFDSCYEQQGFYLDSMPEWIDLTGLDSSNRLCSKEAFAAIRKALSKNPWRKITFMGSGNYHYATLALLELMGYPFTLIVFDHHNDLMVEPDAEHISCGSWIRNALAKIKNLRHVVIVGSTTEERNWIKISPFGSQVDFIDNHRLAEEEAQIEQTIKTKRVYFSIDKDVLDPKEVQTNWDQGKMRLDKLIKIMESVANKHQVMGIDICGEVPISEDFVESMLSCEKNDEVNRKLLKAAFKTIRPRLIWPKKETNEKHG